MISLTLQNQGANMLEWEPIEATVAVPAGGWPRALIRLELGMDCPICEAIYEVARASRQFRRGVVMEVNGTDLFAFPHQSCDEIARTWRRLTAPPPVPPETPRNVVRWTPLRKAVLAADIALNRISFDDACTRHELSPEELQGWIDGYQAHGLDGVKVGKIQAVR
jgi:hypothetical protein